MLKVIFFLLHFLKQKFFKKHEVSKKRYANFSQMNLRQFSHCLTIGCGTCTEVSHRSGKKRKPRKDNPGESDLSMFSSSRKAWREKWGTPQGLTPFSSWKKSIVCSGSHLFSKRLRSGDLNSAQFWFSQLLHYWCLGRWCFVMGVLSSALQDV